MLPADLIQRYTLCNSLPEKLVETWHRGLRIYRETAKGLRHQSTTTIDQLIKTYLKSLVVVVLIMPVVSRLESKND